MNKLDEEYGQIGLFINGLTKGLGIPGFPVSRGAADPQTEKRLQALYKNLEVLGARLKELKYDIQKPGAEIKSETQQIGHTILGLLHTDSLTATIARQKGKELDDSMGLSLETPFSDLLPVISKMYTEITHANYRFIYTLKENTAINEIKLQVFPRSESIAGENAKDTITKYFPLRDKANLKLRNSIGISFTYFRDKNQSYYVKPNLTIGKGKGDLFTPVISSFIHLYSNKNSGCKWGGAFGFGIPLVGDRKEINFMLGPSVVLGRNELILISAGVAGTQVPQLGNGFEVGQTVPNAFFVLPVVYRFRPGGFISISFNLKNSSHN